MLLFSFEAPKTTIKVAHMTRVLYSSDAIEKKDLALERHEVQYLMTELSFLA